MLDLLDVLDLPGRTAELARTYGIDFFSVINRWGGAGGVLFVCGGKGGDSQISRGQAAHAHLACAATTVTVIRCTHTKALHVSVTHTHLPPSLLSSTGAASTVWRACWCAWLTARTTSCSHQTRSR